MTEPKNEVMVREPRSQKLPDTGKATTTTDKPIAPEALRVQRAVLVKSLMGPTEYERFESLMMRPARTQKTASEGEQKRAPSVPVNSV
jgi:hypothetical protein